MQQSTEITSTIDRIASLDVSAQQAVENAKQNMLGAVNVSRQVGHELEALRATVGSQRFTLLLDERFDDGFAERARTYRRIVKADERQSYLQLGVVPQGDKAEAALIKADPYFSWVNKLSGKLRLSKSLTSAERVALKGLQRDVARALGSV